MSCNGVYQALGLSCRCGKYRVTNRLTPFIPEYRRMHSVLNEHIWTIHSKFGSILKRIPESHVIVRDYRSQTLLGRTRTRVFVAVTSVSRSLKFFSLRGEAICAKRPIALIAC